MTYLIQIIIFYEQKRNIIFVPNLMSRYTYTLFFWRLKKFWTIVLALWWRFFFFWASFIPNLSFFRICRIKVWKTSSTKCLRAADVSKNGQSNSLANAWPSSVVTSLLLSKSILFATRTIGVPSPLRTRSICVFAWAASRKLCLSVMEYIMTNPSPLRIYCSLMAVNSCYKLNKNNFVICYWYSYSLFSKKKIISCLIYSCYSVKEPLMTFQSQRWINFSLLGLNLHNFMEITRPPNSKFLKN